jgi:hypothetical protein
MTVAPEGFMRRTRSSLLKGTNLPIDAELAIRTLLYSAQLTHNLCSICRAVDLIHALDSRAGMATAIRPFDPAV